MASNNLSQFLYSKPVQAVEKGENEFFAVLCSCICYYFASNIVTKNKQKTKLTIFNLSLYSFVLQINANFLTDLIGKTKRRSASEAVEQAQVKFVDMMQTDLAPYVAAYEKINTAATEHPKLIPLKERFVDLIDEAKNFFFDKCDDLSKWTTGEEAIKEFQPKFDQLKNLYSKRIRNPSLADGFDEKIIGVLRKCIVDNLNWLKKQKPIARSSSGKKSTDKKATKSAKGNESPKSKK